MNEVSQENLLKQISRGSLVNFFEGERGWGKVILVSSSEAEEDVFRLVTTSLFLS